MKASKFIQPQNDQLMESLSFKKFDVGPLFNTRWKCCLTKLESQADNFLCTPPANCVYFSRINMLHVFPIHPPSSQYHSTLRSVDEYFNHQLVTTPSLQKPKSPGDMTGHCLRKLQQQEI